MLASVLSYAAWWEIIVSDNHPWFGAFLLTDGKVQTMEPVRYLSLSLTIHLLSCAGPIKKTIKRKMKD